MCSICGQKNDKSNDHKSLKHNFKSFNEAKIWAKKHIVGTYRNEDTGNDIYIAKNAIDKYLSASAVLKSVDKDVHLSALMVLPRLIEISVLSASQQDRNNDYHIKEIQRFYGTIRYENVIFPVKITVKVIQNEGNKAYSYEVMKIENPAEHEAPQDLPVPSGQ
ncbi:hypothetical protein AGMMS4956_08400 [Bacteroidia bacterium]|nr:hypothetical protein AGMMS4956_08400 [Bacteroidia bacterium]